jgi:hypothetical protein
MALAATARAYEEIPERDFSRPGHEDNGEQAGPDEIDIIALADNRLIIGEAKRVATLGTNRETSKAIARRN